MSSFFSGGLSSSTGEHFSWAPLLELFLGELARTLHARPELAAQFRSALLLGVHSKHEEAQFSSVKAFALRHGISERTLRYDLKTMTEGVHFHRAGRTGRRLIVHVGATDAWYAERARAAMSPQSVEDLAVDEVTRRRARNALRKRKEK